MEQILQECIYSIDYRELDIAWEDRRNPSDPDAGVPYKFLTVYQEDFRRHHEAEYGDDVLSEIPTQELQDPLSSRLDRIEGLATDTGDKRPPLRFLAGETDRLQSKLDGPDSLKKEDVNASLEAHDRSEALRIEEAYVEGNTTEFDSDYSQQFITDQVMDIRTGLEGSSV